MNARSLKKLCWTRFKLWICLLSFGTGQYRSSWRVSIWIWFWQSNKSSGRFCAGDDEKKVIKTATVKITSAMARLINTLGLYQDKGAQRAAIDLPIEETCTSTGKRRHRLHSSTNELLWAGCTWKRKQASSPIRSSVRTLDNDYHIATRVAI